MIITRTSKAIEIQSPAKVNLFLEVLGKREDGFHEISTVLCPISLFDRVTVEPTDSSSIEFELVLPRQSEPPSNSGETSCSADPAWEIPADASNLVVRAARRVQALLGTSRGCRIRLVKQIPAAAGLGGGSSDAAAVITACLLGWSHWDRELATSVCAEIGSDVPFFLGDATRFGIAHASGRGEHCTFIAARPALDFVLMHPPAGCSTEAVYRGFGKLGKIRDCRTILAACETGQPEKIGAELFNALQLTAGKLTNWIQQQLEIFSDCGASHRLMSGSGSTCFAILDGRTQQAVCNCIRSKAVSAGIARVYEAQAWFGSSIEEQI